MTLTFPDINMLKPNRTGFITDRAMLEHRCEWDDDHIECPARLARIINRLESTSLIDQCIELKSRKATHNDITLVHSIEYQRKINEIESMNIEQMEMFSAQCEDVYVNGRSSELALLSAGCAIEAMDAVIDGR
jgi:acetoin utilization deacetylase AcuC-like enzyme